MTSVLEEYGFLNSDFDGCQYGLVAKFGKGWTPYLQALAHCDIAVYFVQLSARSVFWEPHASTHLRCGGANTKDSQCYTP